jgi:hypothetical protein
MVNQRQHAEIVRPDDLARVRNGQWSMVNQRQHAEIVRPDELARLLLFDH